LVILISRALQRVPNRDLDNGAGGWCGEPAGRGIGI